MMAAISELHPKSHRVHELTGLTGGHGVEAPAGWRVLAADLG